MNALIHGLSNNFIFFLPALEHDILQDTELLVLLHISADTCRFHTETVSLFCLVLFIFFLAH
jgi:hypothetical protein